MFAPTPTSKLILACKDCGQPVGDSENNAYRLIAGVFYGWCNECFKKQQRSLKYDLPSFPPGEPSTVGSLPTPGNP